MDQRRSEEIEINIVTAVGWRLEIRVSKATCERECIHSVLLHTPLVEVGYVVETGVIDACAFDVSEIQTVHAGLVEDGEISVVRQ